MMIRTDSLAADFPIEASEPNTHATAVCCRGMVPGQLENAVPDAIEFKGAWWWSNTDLKASKGLENNRCFALHSM